MKRVMYFVFILMLILSFIFGAPVTVHYKCWLWDSTCLTASSQAIVPTITAGSPELGIAPLDPMRIESLHVDMEGFKHDWRVAYVHGLRDAVIEKLSVDLESKLIRVMFHTNFSVTGHYKTDGILFSLPITGDGVMSMKFNNVQMELIIPFEIVKDFYGKSIVDLRNFHYWFDVKGGASFYLDNLFNGNEELSRSMHIFINQMWKAITTKYGRYMYDLVNEQIFNAIRSYLHTRPLETISLQ